MSYQKPKKVSHPFIFLSLIGSVLGFSLAAAGEARADTYIYFRCNASGWEANFATRMRETVEPGVVALEFDVNAPWMTTSGDDCEITQTDMLDGWGTQTKYYAFGTTGYVFQVPGTQQSSLVAGIDPHIKVRYPSLGRYRALFNRTTLKLTIDSCSEVWTGRHTQMPWQGLASSADGRYLVAVPGGGFVSTSSDGGGTWVDRPFKPDATFPDDAPMAPLVWFSVASSSDGRKLVAGTASGIYISSDYGVNWSRRMPTVEANNEVWARVASSSDGTKLVAVKVTPVSGFLYTSGDSGNTWTQRGTTRNYFAVASSSDGTKLVATVVDGSIYTSTNSGLSWTERGRSLGTKQWRAVASSADGSKLVAVAYEGYIYTSTDSGNTWTRRGSSNLWTSVASSADGTKLAATTHTSVYTSKDSGVSWVRRGNELDTEELQSIASSADGSRLVTAATVGLIYTSNGVAP
jgi:photosystem II stability/assembly factor-like uncharacterized protein